MSNLLVIIPAKASSQEIPLKNLEIIGNESLLSRTLKLAQSASNALRAHTLVSTESNLIYEEICRHFARKNLGEFNEEPFGSIIDFSSELSIHKRPINLAHPLSKTSELIGHLLNKRETQNFNHFLLLQPTSPFRFLAELIELVDLYFETKVSSIATVHKFDSPHPEKKITISGEKSVNLQKSDIEKLLSPRQELGEYWTLDGAFYLFSREAFQRNRQLLHPDTIFHPRTGLKTLNIDTKENLAFAQFIAERGLDNFE